MILIVGKYFASTLECRVHDLSTTAQMGSNTTGTPGRWMIWRNSLPLPAIGILVEAQWNAGGAAGGRSKSFPQWTRPDHGHVRCFSHLVLVYQLLI